MENKIAVPKKLKTERPFDPEIPFLVIYPKEKRSPSQRAICTPMPTAELIKIPRCGNSHK